MSIKEEYSIIWNMLLIIHGNCVSSFIFQPLQSASSVHVSILIAVYLQSSDFGVGNQK